MSNRNDKKEYLEIYKVVRSRIEFEYNQIGNRLNWLIASQAFLFTALVISIKNNVEPLKNNVEPLNNMFNAIDILVKNSPLYSILPFLGLIISFFVIIGIFAAILRIAGLKKKESDLVEIIEGSGRYEYAVIKRNQSLHYFGLCPPIFIPVSFFLIWFMVVNPNLDLGHLGNFNLFYSPVTNSMAMGVILLFIIHICLGIIVTIKSIDAQLENKTLIEILTFYCAFPIIISPILFSFSINIIFIPSPDYQRLLFSLIIAFIIFAALSYFAAWLSMEDLR